MRPKVTKNNYAAACDILNERFGHNYKIIFAHIQDLMNLNMSNKHSISGLRKLEDELLSQESLEGYGMNSDKYVWF